MSRSFFCHRSVLPGNTPVAPAVITSQASRSRLHYFMLMSDVPRIAVLFSESVEGVILKFSVLCFLYVRGHVFNYSNEMYNF